MVWSLQKISFFRICGVTKNYCVLIWINTVCFEVELVDTRQTWWHDMHICLVLLLNGKGCYVFEILLVFIWAKGFMILWGKLKWMCEGNWMEWMSNSTSPNFSQKLQKTWLLDRAEWPNMPCDLSPTPYTTPPTSLPLSTHTFQSQAMDLIIK